MSRRLKVLMQLRKFSGGPSVFRGRLFPFLQEVGKEQDIEFTSDKNDKFDIELSTIRHLTKHKKPKILRVDGCYYRQSEIGYNKHLKRAIQESKYVIYQSRFSQKFCKRLLRLRNDEMQRSCFIHNGIDFNWVDQISKNPGIESESFVACAAWRETKRPLSTIRGFLEADTGRHLYIIGDPSRIAKKYHRISSNVHIVGKKRPEEVISIMKSCSYMLHLTLVDSCPNAVIEGLACGLNVLITNNQGSKELIVQKDFDGDEIARNGIIYKIDGKISKPKKFSKIDNLNSKDVAGKIQELMQIKERADRRDLDIRFVAKRYIDVMKRIV